MYEQSGNYPLALAEYDRAWSHCQLDAHRALVQNLRGLATFKMGDKERALRLLEDAIRLHPEFLEPRVHLAKFRLKMGDFRRAMEELVGAEALLLAQEDRNDGSFLLVPFHDFTKDVVDYSKASISGYVESEVEKVRASRTFPFPRDAQVHDFLSRFYCDPVSRMWRGLDPVPEEVESGGAGVVEGTPTGTGFLVAVACIKSKAFAEVIDHCTAEIDNPKGRYLNEARLLRGTLYLLWRDDARALEDFKVIIDDPDASKEIKSCAHLRAGMVHAFLESSEDSAAHLAKAEELWKENADIYYHVAAGVKDKDVFGALACLKKGLEACPDPKGHPLLHALDLSTRTLQYCIFSDKKRAEETVAKLKEMEGKCLLDTPACYAEFAEALRCSGDEEGMGAAYDKATELSAGYNFYQLEKIKATLKKLDDAGREAVIKQLEKFTDDPDVAASAFELIFELKMKLGKYKEGFAAVDKAIQLVPNIFEVKRLWKEKADFEYVVRLAEKTGRKERAWELKFRRLFQQHE